MSKRHRPRHSSRVPFTLKMWDKMIAERVAQRQEQARVSALHARGLCAGPADEFRRILARAEGTPLPQLVAQVHLDNEAEIAATPFPLRGAA